MTHRLAAIAMTLSMAIPCSCQVLQEWDFTVGELGWIPNGSISQFQPTSQGLDFDSVAEDPNLVGPIADYPITRLLRITVRMRSDADEQGEIFYGETFVAEKSRRFTVIPDGEWHEYSVYLPSLSPRARLRLDPCHLTGHLTVAWIKVENVPNPTLDNGRIEVRLDLASGGAISFLAQSGTGRNLVNIHDRGRYIQQSYYTGQSIDRRAEGQSPNWSPWSWNPIQVGDTYGNTAPILEAWVRDGTAYSKCQPLLWDMNRELAECWMEIWVSLEENRVHARNRLTCFRTDNLWQLTTNDQELPAVYTIGDLFRLKAYVGASPWTTAGLTEFSTSGPPWHYWDCPEHWAALVDANNFGVGVYNKNSIDFIGGFHDTPGGGPNDNSTGYISPLRRERLGKTSILDYHFELIVGTLDDIRYAVYESEGEIFEGGPTSTPVPTRTPTSTPTVTPTPTPVPPASGIRVR